jgi:Na+-transporting methylmalonyl-CoA/oxaloacetate decarboxylase gamma subunit
MNKLLAAVLVGMLSFSTATFAEDQEAPKTKKVCVEQKDAKTGKVKEVCKTIKVHKKFEGTKVPEKAPAKKK